MTTKRYRGSCLCGKVSFEVEADLAKGSSRCDCVLCTKVRNWSVTVKPDAFQLKSGEGDLSPFQRSAESPNHFPFCKHCGVRTHSYGDIPEIGGPFVSVMLSSLDGVSPGELVEGPITYCDGRNDNWWNPPQETRHL